MKREDEQEAIGHGTAFLVGWYWQWGVFEAVFWGPDKFQHLHYGLQRLETNLRMHFWWRLKGKMK